MSPFNSVKSNQHALHFREGQVSPSHTSLPVDEPHERSFHKIEQFASCLAPKQRRILSPRVRLMDLYAPHYCCTSTRPEHST